MDRWLWLVDKNTAVCEAIYACWNPDDQRLRTWDENRITADVLRAIGTSGTVQWGQNTCKAVWKMFQAYGDYETLNGDIALNVVLSTQKGEVLVGVKHFEAKVADPNTHEYKAIRNSQLISMASLTGHEVLLYTIWSRFEEQWWPGCCTGAGSLPTALALGLEAEGHKVLNASASSFVRVLSEALCGRGLDTEQKRVASFLAELSKVDARYVDAITPLEPPQRPSFFMEAHVVIGEGPEPRQNFDPPSGYEPLPSDAPDHDKPSGVVRPKGP